MNNKWKKSVRKINRQRRASLEALVKYLLVFAYENVRTLFVEHFHTVSSSINLFQYFHG